MKKVLFTSLGLVIGLTVFAQYINPKGNQPGIFNQTEKKSPPDIQKTKIINLAAPAKVVSENSVTPQLNNKKPGAFQTASFNTTWGNRFQTVLDSVRLANNIKGISAAVLFPGEGLWTGASGISSAGVPITTGMRFGIGVNSALFIDVILAKLQQQGVLSMDDQLHQWLPGIPHVDSNTTIRQLISHESGIFDYCNDNFTAFSNMVYADTAHIFTPQAILATIGASHFAPGHGYAFSNTNSLLAGMVIAAATGSSWVQKMHDFILNPLTMDSTFIGAFEPKNGPVAHEWIANHGEIVNSPMPSAFSLWDAGGAMLSTPQEMVEWCHSLFSGAIIPDSSLQKLLKIEPATGFRQGFWESDYLGHPYYEMTGYMLGYCAELFYDLQTKALVCILTNQSPANFAAVVTPIIADVLWNEYPKKPNDAGITKILSPWESKCSTPLTPLVTLKNFGSQPLTSVMINYKYDGGILSTYTWTGTLSTNSTVDVTLPSMNIINGYHVFTCYTSLPNGAPEGYTFNDTTESNCIVTYSTTAMDTLSEGFNGLVFPPAGWTENNLSVNPWGRTTLVKYSGSSSVVRANYMDPDVGNFYDLDLPLIHIANGTNPILNFEYAYALNPNNYGDSLKVFISSDCGATWQSLFNKGGASLQTVAGINSDFLPQSSTDWKQEFISLSAFTGDVLIRFRSINGNSNNLYLDNVKVGFATGIEEISSSQKFSVYPNPSSSEINIYGLPVNSEIQITDLTGKLLMTEKTANSLTSLEIQQLSQGVYFLRTTMGVKKIVKM